MTEGKIQSAVRYPSDLTDEEGNPWAHHQRIGILYHRTPTKTWSSRTPKCHFFIWIKQVVPGGICQKTSLPTSSLITTILSGQIIVGLRKSMRCFVSGYAKKRPKARSNGS